MPFLRYFSLAFQVHRTKLSDVTHRRYRKRYKNDVCFDIFLQFEIKVVRDPCQKITLLLLKSKSVRVIVPESCF